jgi:amino acid transporter
MIEDFIYSLTNLQLFLLVVSLGVAISILGLLVTVRIIPPLVRKSHNEHVGFVIAVVGVVYAVVLAFIAIAVWETFDHCDALVQREAGFAGDIYLDATSLPATVRDQVQSEIATYAKTVVDEEWPAMARGEPIGQKGWQVLQGIRSNLSAFRSNDGIEVALFSETFKALNLLYGARRERIIANTESVQAIVYAVIILGGLITVAFTYFFGMHSFGLHLAMTAGTGAMISLVILLVVAFDHPFRGKVNIKPEAFTELLAEIQGQKVER